MKATVESVTPPLGSSGHGGLPGLYVHVPFCPQICPYCAFAKVVDNQDQHERYIAAVCWELEQLASRRLVGAEAFGTAFFGGGTPSLLAPSLVRQVVETATQCQGIAEEAEITIEVNPGTADEGKFLLLREAGFNRLSIGVQAFDDAGLKALGRVHDVAAAEAAFNAGRRAGFDNVSLDLISGVPGGSADAWRQSVERALQLRPEHISAYALTIEEGTPFAERRRQGRLPTPSEEVETDALVWTAHRLEAAGYEHYEVSNYALPGRRSRHNSGYWAGLPYLGIGVSAHSYFGNIRSWNHRDLSRYLESVEAGQLPRAGSEELDAGTKLCERIWLGLRTSTGVLLSPAESEMLGASPRMEQIRNAGFLQVDGNRLYPTAAGFPIADALGLEVTGILESATEFAPRIAPSVSEPATLHSGFDPRRKTTRYEEKLV